MSSGKIQWQEEYALGIEELDRQHQVLFEIHSHLVDLLHARSDSRQMQRVVQALMKYATVHFEYEEYFFRDRVGLSEHAARHAEFLGKLTGTADRLQSGVITGWDLAKMVGAWIHEHVLEDDITLVNAPVAASDTGRS